MSFIHSWLANYVHKDADENGDVNGDTDDDIHDGDDDDDNDDDDSNSDRITFSLSVLKILRKSLWRHGQRLKSLR